MKSKTIFFNQPAPRIERLNRIAIETIVAILLVVWLHTGLSKLFDYQSFRIQMQQSPIFHDYAQFVTFGGPSLELVIAILLIFKKTRMVGMIGSFLLMCFFTWYVWWLMTHLPTLPCSCGGIVGFLNWPQHLSLNIFLTTIAFIAIMLLRKQAKAIRLLTRPNT